MKAPATRHARGGFTLLELVVVVAILAVLAGAALPVASKAWASAARRATNTRLEELARAALEFCRDTGRPPAEIVELVVRPPDVDTWIGPYVPDVDADLDRAGEPVLRDAWSRPIVVRPEPRFALVSRGPDGVASADDLARPLDFTPLRREITLAELATAQRAIDAWCARHPDETLPRDWRDAAGVLVRDGLLADDPALERDAWGEVYAADPRSRGGLVRLVSPALLSRSAGSTVETPRTAR